MNRSRASSRATAALSLSRPSSRRSRSPTPTVVILTAPTSPLPATMIPTNIHTSNGNVSENVHGSLIDDSIIDDYILPPSALQYTRSQSSQPSQSLSSRPPASRRSLTSDSHTHSDSDSDNGSGGDTDSGDESLPSPQSAQPAVMSLRRSLEPRPQSANASPSQARTRSQSAHASHSRRRPTTTTSLLTSVTAAYIAKLSQSKRAEVRRRNEEEKILSTMARNAMKKEMLMEELTNHWLTKILPQYSATNTKIKLKAKSLLQRGGIPVKIRGQVWTTLMGNQLMIDKELYQIVSDRAKKLEHDNKHRIVNDSGSGSVSVSDSVSVSGSDSAAADGSVKLGELATYGKSSTISYIDMDIERTFPSFPFFHCDSPLLPQQLRHLLFTYVIYRPDVGYVQSLTYLAGYVLLVIDDDYKAFVIFANLLNSSFFHCFLKMDLEFISLRYQFFYDLVKSENEKLYNHLVDSNITPELFFLEWCMTLFAKRLPLDIVARVWDYYLLYGELVVYRLAVAIVLVLKAQLMECTEMHQLLKILRESPMTIGEGELMKEFDRVSVSERQTAKMNEIVRRQQSSQELEKEKG